MVYDNWREMCADLALERDNLAKELKRWKPPCMLGDTVWCFTRRGGNGGFLVASGRVSEMYYTENMQLSISVYHLCRGVWGKTVFATREEAEEAAKRE